MLQKSEAAPNTLDLATAIAGTPQADFHSDRYLRNTARRLEHLASLGLENPQVAWGADLISRINHAIKEPGAAETLRQAAVNAINALAHDLARAVGAQAGDIADAVVCGNTAMQHLLAGWPVSQLGRAPFVSAMNEALDVPARSLGLKLAAGANLHLAASVGGFVGGDHVAAMLATEPDPSSICTVTVHLGTGMRVRRRRRSWVGCSAPPSMTLTWPVASLHRSPSKTVASSTSSPRWDGSTRTTNPVWSG